MRKRDLIHATRAGRSRTADVVQFGHVLVGEESPAPAMFSRRWAVDEVPGMSRMFGERRISQASATDIGVASSRPATWERASDWSGVKPPRGKNGT